MLTNLGDLRNKLIDLVIQYFKYVYHFPLEIANTGKAV